MSQRPTKEPDIAEVLMKEYLRLRPDDARECEEITWRGRHPLRPVYKLPGHIARKIDRAADQLPGDKNDQFRLLVRLVLNFAFFGEKHTPGDGFDNGAPWDEDVTELYEEVLRNVRLQVKGQLSGRDGGLKTQAKREKVKAPNNDGTMADKKKSEPVTTAPAPASPQLSPDELQAYIDAVQEAQSKDAIVKIINSDPRLKQSKQFLGIVKEKLERLELPF